MVDILKVFFIVLGLGMMIGAIVWRQVRRARARHDLRVALADPDPETRMTAINVIALDGIGHFAKELRKVTEAEHDDRVLDTLRDAILRNQWEPADQRSLVALRMWAISRMDDTVTLDGRHTALGADFQNYTPATGTDGHETRDTDESGERTQ